MQHKYSAAVVGCGAGGNLSIDALATSELFELVAVCDMRSEATAAVAARYPGVRTFADYQTMFVACPVDVVCVSTYAPTHAEIAHAALTLPLKGILLEKPLTDSVQTARALLDVIEQRGLPMIVPHGLMAHTHSREILQRVHAGEIGELKLIEIEFGGWDTFNAGPHTFNFVVALTGNAPVDWVMSACESSTRTYRDGMQVETTSITYVQTKQGIRMVMQAGDEVSPNIPGKGVVYRIIGTAGMIEFYMWENAYRLFNATHPSGELIVPTPLPMSVHQYLLEQLADMITSGKSDYSIAEASFIASEICEAAYLSNRHQCKVLFPVTDFIPPAKPVWDPGTPYRGTGGGRDGRY